MKRKKTGKVKRSDQNFFLFANCQRETKRLKFFFLFASKRKIRSETKQKQAKKLRKQNQDETDHVSLRFALK
jgi:hypothetical protein